MNTQANSTLSEMLPPDVAAALADFQRRLLRRFPQGIRQVILYGSYARGEAEPGSDVDVMVVVDWDDPQRMGGYYLGRPSDPRWTQIVDAAVDAMIAHGPFISVLVVDERLFRSNWPVARAARREGKVLWKNPRT
ncbi:MAG: nucleotidyltransferase domain-containing protein [Chloroflexi bacterium]|nr:MAG: nucleotidyltransferase domain-containing protein [Chloroflexota bacterium]